MGFWLFSGIDGELGWKTVPPTERSIRVNPINPCSKKTRRLNEHGFIGFNGFYQRWYCLPDSSPFIIGNPETSSRVTLATLGIVFQTKLITNYKHGAECWLEASTERKRE